MLIYSRVEQTYPHTQEGLISRKLNSHFYCIHRMKEWQAKRTLKKFKRCAMHYIPPALTRLYTEHLYFSISHKHQGISGQQMVYSRDHSRHLQCCMYSLFIFSFPGIRVCSVRSSTTTGLASCTTPLMCVDPCLRRSWSTGAWTAIRSVL